MAKQPLYPHIPKSRLVEAPSNRKVEADDLREVLCTIYDSMSVVAGGEETALRPELSLLKSKVDALVNRGVLEPFDRDKIVPEYISAVVSRDGLLAHFWSRMIFGRVADILKNMAIEGR